MKELAAKGFRNIELTGGTRYYEHWQKDLLELKEKYNLNYLVHNYFPPPQAPFILNLASLDPDIYQKSIDHLNQALDLTRRLGAPRFGFHAGFLVDRPVAEIGKPFGKSKVNNRKQAFAQFIQGVTLLKNRFPDIQLYIENNCYSQSNYAVYGQTRPFMLLDAWDCHEMKNLTGLDLLLDVGHLKVSTSTLDLDFEKEFNTLFNRTDYIHISDNDGYHDQNLGLSQGCEMFDLLAAENWAGKTITLEIYQGMDILMQTHDLVSSFKGLKS